MKTKIISAFVFGAAFLAGGVLAQTATLASNSTPAPAASAAPAPNQIIYAPRLPSPAELTSAAAAQGLTVQRIEQTSAQVTVIYQYSNGQTNTVAYQLLPAGATPSTQTAPAPTVVYDTAPRVVYYDSYGPDYYPGYWYPWYAPVSVRLGVGFHGGYGFRGGWGGRGHWR